MDTTTYIDANGTLVTVLPPQRETKAMRDWSRPKFGKDTISHISRHRDHMRSKGYAKA